MDDTATPRPRLEREMVREALEGLAELVVRGVRASADPGEAAGKAGAGLRALGGWVERLAGEGSEAVSEGRKPMQLRAELPVERGLMSVGIPSAVGVLDPGDFPEAFVVVRETEEEVLLAEGDSFLIVEGAWSPVVVPGEVAGGVAVEKLEVAEAPVVACEAKVEAVMPVEVFVEKEVIVAEELPVVAEPEVVVPVGVLEPVVEVRVPDEAPVVEGTPVVAAPVIALEPEVKVPEAEPVVEEKESEVEVPELGLDLAVKTEMKGSEPVVAAATAVSAGEVKEPVGAGRGVVEWRMPEPVAVAPSSRGPGVVMRVMVLVLLVLVGWLVYKVLVPRGY